MGRYLLVAHQTAEREELLETALDLAAHDQRATFTVLVPATPIGNLMTWQEGEAKEVARARAKAAAALLQRHGLNVIGVRVGDADPVLAEGGEFLDGRRYDTIVISTLPVGISRWIKMDVVSRLHRAHPRVRVIHVVAGSQAEETVS